MTDKEIIKDMLTRAGIAYVEDCETDWERYYGTKAGAGGPKVPWILEPSDQIELTEGDKGVHGYMSFKSNWFFAKSDGRLLAVANWE